MTKIDAVDLPVVSLGPSEGHCIFLATQNYWLT